jgi:hypothetical protein
MRSTLCHILNPLHIYCRLRSIGVPKRIAKPLALVVGKIIRPALYPGNDRELK